MMKCPRCQNLLRMHEPSAQWLRWFECEECCMGYSLILSKIGKDYSLNLEQGRRVRNEVQ